MRVVQTLAADGTVALGPLHKPRGDNMWEATFFAKGTFGGGTLSFQWADDGDTANLIPMTDISGTQLSYTQPDCANARIGLGSGLTDQPKFYATLIGATAPSLTVGYLDTN